ncbi:hypothetical protein GTY75_06660 [Streptomyces sp. SID8381]|uniref:hypothetical protein n=1 Tax=unclassified Streptomyces TaxID=2593676 RepID=UPI00035D63EE|nr:hypothetical protein [Streptomyces sp. Amel2xE9]MYX26358.1 hypothetical protein [Streptomyces sp. SID8381]
MARSAWRRRRELTRTRADTAQESPARPGPDRPAAVGLIACLATVVVVSLAIIVGEAISGRLKLPWGGLFTTLTAGLVLSVAVISAVRWAVGARQRRRAAPTGGSPPVGRTEDGQNSVETL